jgi:hypothetical protein
MQPATKTGNVTTVIGGVIIFFLTLAMSSLTISSALATPESGPVGHSISSNYDGTATAVPRQIG